MWGRIPQVLIRCLENCRSPKRIKVWHTVSDHSKGKREPLQGSIVLEPVGYAGTILWQHFKYT